MEGEFPNVWGGKWMETRERERDTESEKDLDWRIRQLGIRRTLFYN